MTSCSRVLHRDMKTTLVYLHGFNSSPQSHKARTLQSYLETRGLGGHFACPALPHSPDAAIAEIEALIGRLAGAATLVGSSLGGFYATHLAEKHGLRAALINPAVAPQKDLDSYLGPQRNLYTGQAYVLTRAHLEAWRKLAVAGIEPHRYLLLLETGDEVLDYRAAVRKYRGAQQIVVEGGDHSFVSFEQHIPALLAFADRA